MREKLGACSFCIKWSIRGLVISALLLIASLLSRIFLLIIASLSVLAFFSVLTSLHLIFYVKRREKCIKRVSGESRRRFLSTAVKLVVGLALYSIIGRIPILSAKPDMGPIKSLELSGEDLKEAMNKALMSEDLKNVLDGFKADLRGAKAAKHLLSLDGRELTLLATAIPADGERIVAYYEYSEPVNHVKTQAYLFKVDDNKAITERVSINGYLVGIDATCPSYCSSDNDCPPGYYCHIYCCSLDLMKAISCCAFCRSACGNPYTCIACLSIWCWSCIMYACNAWGYKCVYVRY